MQTQSSQLSGPEFKPLSGGRPKQLVLILHGVGADGKNLISLAPEFAKVLPDAHFISPNAPFAYDMGGPGYQWFSLMNRDLQIMLEGARTAAPILEEFANHKLEEFDLKQENLVYVGFSQGCVMSLYVSLRAEKQCAGVLGYSGWLARGADFTNEIRSRPPVCLVHGANDMVVPFSALGDAEEALKAEKIPVEAHARPDLDHSIDLEGVEIGKQFLERILKKLEVRS